MRAHHKKYFKFQSAPPVKAATILDGLGDEIRIVSIRAAREGGDVTDVNNDHRMGVSIRAAREGGDQAQPLHFA